MNTFKRKQQALLSTIQGISSVLGFTSSIWLVKETEKALRFAVASELLDERVCDEQRILDEFYTAPEACRSEQTVTVTDIRLNQQRAWLLDTGVRSVIATPLRIKKKIVGVLEVYIPQKANFDIQQHVSLIEYFASQAVLNLRQTACLEALSEVETLMSLEVEHFSSLLEQIMLSSQKVIDCEHVSIFLLEYGGLIRQASSSSVKRERFEAGEGLAGKVVETGAPLIVGNTKLHQDFIPGLSSDIEEHSMLVVPIKFQEEIIGVISADRDGIDGFDHQDLVFLESLSKQTVIAIHNFKLFQENNRLQKVSRAVNLHAKLEQVIEETLNSLRNFIQYDKASVQIIQDGQRFLVGAAGFEKDEDCSPKLLRNLKDDQLVNAVVTSRKVSVLSNIEDEPLWEAVSETENVRSWICAPLIVGDDVIGLLTIDHHEAGFYTYEREGKLAENFAKAVSADIKKSQFLHQTEKLSRQWKMLVQVGKELASRIDFQEDEIFELLEREIRESLEIENVTIALYDRDTEEIRFVQASRGGKPVNFNKETGWAAYKKGEGGKGKTEWIIENRKPLLLSSQKEIKQYGFSSIPGNEVEQDERIPNSWLGVPMMLRGRVLGVITLFSYNLHRGFTQDDSDIFQALAGKTALALGNTKKYNTIYNKLLKVNVKQESLIDLTHELTSGIDLTEDEILELIPKQASKVMDTDNMYIALYNEDDDEVRFGLVFLNGIRVNIEEREEYTPRRGGSGKTEWIIKNKEKLFHRTKAESEEWYTQSGNKEYFGYILPSWIGVPMLVGDKVLGVIATYHPSEENRYNEEDVEILQSMGESAAIALENASKYNKSEQWAFLGHLSSSIAHIIGNKGGIIRLCAQDLQYYLNNIGFSDEWIVNQIEKIDKTNQYLLDFSDDLFKPLKATYAELSSIDIIEYLKQAQSYTEIPDDVYVKYNQHNKLQKILGNKYLIEVFQEIMWNAVRAMRDSEKKTLTIDVQSHAKHVEIRFSDTGKGISSDDEGKIFELFQKNNNDGTFARYTHKGFGLWWIKSFLKQINGEIYYEHSLSDARGAIFVVKLPVADKQQ